jgi:hypothetical protein
MELIVEVDEGGPESPLVIACSSTDGELVSEVVARSLTAHSLDVVDVRECFEQGSPEPGADALVGDLAVKRLRIRVSCIDIHFEGERIRRRFPSRWSWSGVHRWGCHHFRVAEDACANLELRNGSATGPALNEGLTIGPVRGCRVVWLVKPGPEPYGVDTR